MKEILIRLTESPIIILCILLIILSITKTRSMLSIIVSAFIILVMSDMVFQTNFIIGLIGGY